MDLCLLTIDCSVEEYNAFERMAQERGMSLSQWVVMSAKSQVSARVWNPQPEITNAKNLEAVHKELDKLEIETGIALPPKPKQVEEKRIIPKTGNANGLSGHPCANLAAGMYPPNHNSKTCMGLCTAPGVGQKPCYFAPGVAKQCSIFQPKRLPGK